MEPGIKQPTSGEITAFLGEYGWSSKVVKNDEGVEAVISNYRISGVEKDIGITFRVEGEFVIVSTVGLLKNVPGNYASYLLKLNDTIKLVKIYSVGLSDDGSFEADVGFELWNESWNKEAFFSFMDMLCLGIDNTVQNLTDQHIPFETQFLN